MEFVLQHEPVVDADLDERRHMRILSDADLRQHQDLLQFLDILLKRASLHQCQRITPFLQPLLSRQQLGTVAPELI